MSTTDQTLLSNVQVALIEPANGGQSWPSQLWTREEMVASLNYRQDRLLFDTLLMVKASTALTYLPVIIGQKRVNLPTDWLRTVSVVWRGNDNTVRELLRSDSFESDHTISTWESANASYPLVYHEFEAPNLQIQIAPGPTVAGNLDLLYVPTATEANGSGVSLLVPDELEHAVRYGVLADALAKDGRGKDPVRSAYAESRYDLAVELTRIILEGWS